MKAIHLFVAGTLSVLGVSATPISFIDLFGTQVSTQTADGSTAAIGAYLGTNVYLQNSGDFTSATVTPPGGSATNMPASSATTFYYGSPLMVDLAALDAAYPTGLYTYDIAGPGGNPDAPSTVTVTRPANAYATSTPFLTNFSALGGMNPAQSLMLTWDSFTGALNPTNDSSDPDHNSYVFFGIIRDSDSVNVFEAGFQPGTSTATTLAANTLAPNTAYTFYLIFSNRAIGTTTSGTTAFPPIFGFDLRTEGSFLTGDAVAAPEPMSMGLVFSGLALLAFRRRRK